MLYRETPTSGVDTVAVLNSFTITEVCDFPSNEFGSVETINFYVPMIALTKILSILHVDLQQLVSKISYSKLDQNSLRLGRPM